MRGQVKKYSAKITRVENRNRMDPAFWLLQKLAVHDLKQSTDHFPGLFLK